MTDNFLMGCMVVVLILAALAVNFLGIPFGLMLLLKGFGIELGYWMCFGIWFFICLVIKLLKS